MKNAGAMHWKETYMDLEEEIQVLEHRERELTEQLELAYQMCYDGKMPGDSFSRMPLDKALETYDNVRAKLNTVQEWLEKKRQTKKNMDESIGRMKSLEGQVFYRRSVMRQTIRQIARDMGYSEGYIKNVSYRMVQGEEFENRRNVTFL